MKKFFTKSELLCLGLPESAIKNVIYDGCSVFNMHEIVFNYEGKYYKTNYKSKKQGLMPAWLHNSTIECVEVKPVVVTTTKWVEVL